MLPGSQDLPLLRAAIDARPSEGARKDFLEKYKGSGWQDDEEGRFVYLWINGILRVELEDAINRHLNDAG
jgi:hypothetical protein